MSPSSTTNIIPIVGLGKYREYGLHMKDHFASTPYRMAAFVDLTGEPEAFQYTPHNLGVVLRALHPRPKVFIIGAAISHEMAQESTRAFEEYVKDTEGEDTLIINLCDEPPEIRGEWAAAIMQRLDDKYKGLTR